MRLLPSISYGTEGYPEKIARRLRAMNLAAWIYAAVVASFAIRRLLDPSADKIGPGLTNAGAAIVLACLPLLHRFGPLAGPAVFVAFAYPFAYWVVAGAGTDGGGWLVFLAAVPVTVLLFGAEHLLITGLCATASAVLIILAHIFVPESTGYLSEQSLFYGNFIISVVATTVMLFVIVHYALRQVNRAEATAER